MSGEAMKPLPDLEGLFDVNFASSDQWPTELPRQEYVEEFSGKQHWESISAPMEGAVCVLRARKLPSESDIFPIPGFNAPDAWVMVQFIPREMEKHKTILCHTPRVSFGTRSDSP